MNFEEWKEANFFTDLESPDLEEAWNAALDEAVKAISRRQDYSSRTRDEFARTVEALVKRAANNDVD